MFRKMGRQAEKERKFFSKNGMQKYNSRSGLGDRFLPVAAAEHEQLYTVVQQDDSAPVGR
jgi:hypothetical protein